MASVNRESCGSPSGAQVLLTLVSFRFPNARSEALTNNNHGELARVCLRTPDEPGARNHVRALVSLAKQSLLLRKAGNSSHTASRPLASARMYKQPKRAANSPQGARGVLPAPWSINHP